MKPLTATARLQFHKDFTLDTAVALVPYFDRLGVSHVYASPLLRARPGSTHGYDIVDHNLINPELGGEPALHRLVDALRQHGMGLILDIVPNHMGVGGADNAWWLDVLEWGRESPYAGFFDVDWDPPDASLRGRLLAPFLGSPYGECLERGELTLQFDPQDGRLFVDYYGSRFPICPHDYAAVLLSSGGPLETPARAFSDLPAEQQAMREATAAARRELRRPEYARAIEEALEALSPQTPLGRDRLHRLLERQNYRLAWWRAASDEINWRRFFDVNTLAGIRAEEPDVFEATHETVFRLFAEGLIDGVRIDHVDGLAKPRAYCRKLRRRLDALISARPEGASHAEPVIWIEKILATHERLPTDWLTDGTTGYDFMNDVSAVLHAAEGEAEITRIWTEHTSRAAAFETEAQAARRQILRDSLSSELYATSVALHRIARRDLETRDYTLTAIQRVLTELLVHFHVYRIYAGPGGLSETDRQALEWALAGARRTVRATDQGLLARVAIWLGGDDLRQVPSGLRRNERLRAMTRFQQLSSPTAAKSVEDTTFYRFGRLLSRNEVGSEPSQFALSVAGFHAANRERARRFPRALLATATHDHKRGEDARARLATLSEIPAEWEAALARWRRLNAPLKRDLDGPAPDAADEIMLYETLLGAWPFDLSPDDHDGLAALRERVAGWQEKALREAKRRTGWAVPDEAYEQACQDFLSAVLDPERPTRVVQEIASFVGRIAPAGALNGLSQAMLRMTCPGVPDLYQGTEYWDLSLVDPDNRRPVDFPDRARTLAAAGSAVALLDTWRDGHAKQALVSTVLKARAAAPDLYNLGDYVALPMDGPAMDHALAFLRSHGDRLAIVVVSRLSLGGELGAVPLLAREFWDGTAIALPRQWSGRQLRNLVTEETLNEGADRLAIGDILGRFPVALLEG